MRRKVRLGGTVCVRAGLGRGLNIPFAAGPLVGRRELKVWDTSPAERGERERGRKDGERDRDRQVERDPQTCSWTRRRIDTLN